MTLTLNMLTGGIEAERVEDGRREGRCSGEV